MFILQKLMVHIKLQTSLNSLLVDGLIKFIELIKLIELIGLIDSTFLYN